MNLVDANVLLYATNEDAVHHQEAADWLRSALGSGSPVGLTWVVLLAFLRLSTKASVFPSPLSPEQAVRQVRGWLHHPRSVEVHPTARHADVLGGLLVQAGGAGNLVTDAHLAAIAVEHDATIVTYDTDFARFEGVRWQRPTV